MKLPLVTRRTVPTWERGALDVACMMTSDGRACCTALKLVGGFELACRDGGFDGDRIEAAGDDVKPCRRRSHEAQQFARRLRVFGADRHAGGKAGHALDRFGQAGDEVDTAVCYIARETCSI